MNQLSLLRRGHELAEAARQVEFLRQRSHGKSFEQLLDQHQLAPFTAAGLRVLQINVGKLCNQTCQHCHVDAGPDRREVMTRDTMQQCVEVLAATDIPVVDITGGAPEMNPNFRWLVEQCCGLGRHVIDRCNLTILQTSRFQDLPQFLADHQVEVVASLPCYLEENTDAQRGDGVFRDSIDALRTLNELGYGQAGTGLLLTLVYNPIGPSLPPAQASLEDAYRRELKSRYGIVFSRLFTITNLPISRFLEHLIHTEQFDTYMQKLVDAFNPEAARGVMCRTTLSVDWNGRLYDCDFNQMLGLGLAAEQPQDLAGFDAGRLGSRRIVTGQHCLGCTAGAGSSCQGAIV